MFHMQDAFTVDIGNDVSDDAKCVIQRTDKTNTDTINNKDSTDSADSMDSVRDRPRLSLDETRSNFRDQMWFRRQSINAVFLDKYSGEAIQNSTPLLFNPSSQKNQIPKHSSKLCVDKKEFRWNAIYQDILSQDETLEKYDALVRFVDDFVATAESFGKIIISEMFLPYDQKTIKPVVLGGVAGGEKFIAKGIFFKLAVNKYKIYKSDEDAAKVAGHELKGLQAFYDVQISNLHLPLAALIDYRGYRVYAISVLPIKTTTIQYGSCDAGNTIHAENSELNDLMQTAASFLNIKGHMVKGKLLYMPVDIEIHEGLDDRFYLCDCARIFPCEDPRAQDPEMYDKASYLVRLLRPEFVMNYMKPLSPDAFSPFDRFDPEREINRQEVKDATQYLYTKLIPKFVEIAEATTSFLKEDYSLTQEIHQFGINARHILKIYDLVTDSNFKTVILTECVVRVVKRIIKEQQRQILQNFQSVVRTDALQPRILGVLNEVFGQEHDEITKLFWEQTIQTEIRFFFGKHDIPTGFHLRDSLNISLFFKRFESLTGIVVTKAAIKQLSQSPDSFVFVEADVPAVKAVVKRLNTVTVVEGALHLYKALQMRQYKNFARLFEFSKSMFEKSIKNSLDEQYILFKWASLLFYCSKRSGWPIESCELALQKIELANEKRKSRMVSNTDMFVLWGNIASYLGTITKKKGLFKTAAIVYSKALKNNSNALDITISNAQTKQRVELTSLIQTCFYDSLVEEIVRNRLDVGPVIALEQSHFVTDEVIRFCVESNTSTVVEIAMSNSQYLTDHCLEIIASKCDSIVVLEMFNCPNITFEAILRFAQFNSKLLWIGITQFADRLINYPLNTPLHVIKEVLTPNPKRKLIYGVGMSKKKCDCIRSLTNWNIEIASIPIIQTGIFSSVTELVKKKLLQAYAILKTPCFIDYAEIVTENQRISSQDFEKIGLEEFSKEYAGHAVDISHTLCYTGNGNDIEIFTNSFEAVIITPPREPSLGHGWDSIVIPFNRYNTVTELISNHCILNRKYRHILQLASTHPEF